MQHDESELSPGRKDFWDDFYDADGGRLCQKEASHRRADELQARGSLLDHYEWFMEFPLYEAPLVTALSQNLTLPEIGPDTGRGGIRVLHIGCGNSDFADHVPDVLANAISNVQWTTQPAQVLNIDVCENILAHLSAQFPHRLYAVGSCCALTTTTTDAPAGEEASGHLSSSTWYTTVAPSSSATCTTLSHICPSSVDIVFDKGTVDALLSAFVGEYNSNVADYATESLKVLRPGGILFVISINSADTLDSYFLAAASEDESKYFHCCYEETIHLSKRGPINLRVETLGSRYNCRAYVVRTD